MGLLINGAWSDQWYDTKKTDGHFVRQESSFRNRLGSEQFQAEAGRYSLYVSYACPWAHRATILRELKELKSLIPVIYVHPLMKENGWELDQSDDRVNHKRFLHEIYTLADPNYTGRVTVPVLWDIKEKTIVNNESSEIIRMFNSAFNSITGNKLDYYPHELRGEIDKINDFVYHKINNGVYKAGFATQQLVYEKEVNELFAALDELEDRLDQQRYLVGKQITEADWRLFTTLLRFDAVYVGHFKCNIRRIADYPNLSNYLKELYQIAGIKKTIDMRQIKEHYYMSHATINPTALVPLGPTLHYDQPHDRNRF